VPEGVEWSGDVIRVHYGDLGRNKKKTDAAGIFTCQNTGKTFKKQIYLTRHVRSMNTHFTFTQTVNTLLLNSRGFWALEVVYNEIYSDLINTFFF